MPDITTLLPLLVLFVVVGAIAGIISGLFGVGGGIILVPAFYYGFANLGYDGPQLMQICVATSLATIITTSPQSLRAHHKHGAVEWQILKQWAPYLAMGSLVGFFLASMLRSATLVTIFGVIGLCIGLYMGFGKSQWRLSNQMPKGIARAVSGMMIGSLSVIMGIGGGSFAVPLMTLHNVPIHRAVATSSGFGLLLAIPAVVGFAFLPIEDAPPFTVGALNLPALVIVVLVAGFSTSLGAKMAHAMDPKRLKRVFGIFVGVLALNMLRKAIGS